uniref:Glycerol kinase 5 n=1 Tax=Timema douglasi TaxID=61478 RepID=A0A7R8V9F8_TIMDO|nr:unnamed protein product [Timema douglasi]
MKAEKKCCSSSTNGLSESFLPRLYLSRQQFLLVNRSTWEARPADHTMEANLTTPANHVIVAHTGSAPCVTLSECSKITRVIQGFQMDDLGYADIAYNFLVGGDSQVYEGRGWDTQGALAAHYNNMSLGVAFIGIFEKTAPLMQQLEEFQTFLNVSVEKGKLSADYKLIGHRQVSITDSPGQALYDIIRTWSHWEDYYMKTCFTQWSRVLRVVMPLTELAEVELLYPETGREEIDPEKLWTTVLKVIRSAVENAGVSLNQVTCLGISTQRSTFTTWHKDTGKTFHNFITWKDIRADGLVRYWNNSYKMMSLRTGARLLYTFTRSKRFLAGSVLRLMNTQVTMRLVWALQHVESLKEAASQGHAMFGTVDTWLLYRLTAGRLHVTDVSNASATGMYDPFTMDWGSWALQLFNIPGDMLPKVCDTAANFGVVDPRILGTALAIRCSMADQAASLFGLCCFQEGDVKVTMGTGTFINLNTGKTPHASVAGLYPLVGWRYKDEIVYVAEGASNDTGSLVKWAQQVGFVNTPAESAEQALSVKDSDGVFFVPAFNGLQAPINDYQAAAGFIGLKPTTSKHHMVRAILESLAFRVVQLYDTLQQEAGCDCSLIRVDGGVSHNDFVCQLLADLIEIKVERPTSTEMSVLGVGFLAGLYSGVWKSKEELCQLRKVDRVFEPQKNSKQNYEPIMTQWSEALTRFFNWY